MPRHTTPAIVLAAALLLPLGAFAAEATPPQGSETTAESNVDGKIESKTDSKTASAKTRKPACDGTTASRIRRDKAGKCLPSAAPTRSYTKDDIESTGQTDMGEALKRLDPRFY